MTDGVSLVVRAWLDEGPEPRYHCVQKAWLRSKWPTLYWAIEELVRESQ